MNNATSRKTSIAKFKRAARVIIFKQIFAFFFFHLILIERKETILQRATITSHYSREKTSKIIQFLFYFINVFDKVYVDLRENMTFDVFFWDEAENISPQKG